MAAKRRRSYYRTINGRKVKVRAHLYRTPSQTKRLRRARLRAPTWGESSRHIQAARARRLTKDPKLKSLRDSVANARWSASLQGGAALNAFNNIRPSRARQFPTIDRGAREALVSLKHAETALARYRRGQRAAKRKK